MAHQGVSPKPVHGGDARLHDPRPRGCCRSSIFRSTFCRSSRRPPSQVLTYYQGMPASSVEKTITNRIERWVNQAPGAEIVESKSVPGVSIVKIYFRDDIDPNAALTLTNSLALGTLPTLPPNTLPPVVLPFDPTGTMPLGILTVSNPTRSTRPTSRTWPVSTSATCSAASRACVAPVVVGGKDRTILVYLDPKKTARQEAFAARRGHGACRTATSWSRPAPLTSATTRSCSTPTPWSRTSRTSTTCRSGIEPGDNVYLRDVGRAEDSYAIQTSRVRINGKQPGLRTDLPPEAAPAASTWPTGSAGAHRRTWRNGCRRGRSSNSSWINRFTSARPSQPDSRGHHRRHAGVDDDPDLPGQLAHDADRQPVDPAGHPRRRSSASTSPATPSTP